MAWMNGGWLEWMGESARHVRRLRHWGVVMFISAHQSQATYRKFTCIVRYWCAELLDFRALILVQSDFLYNTHHCWQLSLGAMSTTPSILFRIDGATFLLFILIAWICHRLIPNQYQGKCQMFGMCTLCLGNLNRFRNPSTVINHMILAPHNNMNFNDLFLRWRVG